MKNVWLKSLQQVHQKKYFYFKCLKTLWEKEILLVLKVVCIELSNVVIVSNLGLFFFYLSQVLGICELGVWDR